MKVTYLYHSGFAVELQKHVLIFDYIQGKLPVWDQDKTILFFASHKHQDHFVLQIFDYFSQYKNIHYFLGPDIRLNENYLKRRGVEEAVLSAITRVGKRTVVRREDVSVETLRSTDEGVAFVVSAEGQTIYHAGDLNWWHWEGEEPAWNARMKQDYQEEIERISGRHFDAAFVPLDPRLGESFHLGLKLFLEQTRADAVFPMHMWEDYAVIPRFLACETGRKYAGQVREITAAGQEFEL